MDTRKLLLVACVAFLLIAVALAADKDKDTPDQIAAATAALKANLGNAAGLEVNEVRVTDAGVACINYRVGTGSGEKSRGHAVVKDGDVIDSAADGGRFEKAWNAHCLGPRGGMTSGD